MRSISDCTCPEWDPGQSRKRYSILCPIHGDPRLSNVTPKETTLNEHEIAAPRVKVSFHRSSTKDGGTGFSVEASEGCTKREAERVFDLALELKQRADEALKGPSLEEKLEESLAR